MDHPADTLDRVARRIIQAAEGDLRRAFGVPQLDRALVAALYLRVRDCVGQLQTTANDGAIDELALTIYLTASAWQSNNTPAVDLLASLHDSIASTLEMPQLR